ncbi:MAG TPA: ABC transporter permease subunit [Chloroflexota bacterium]|nr:ABC transporter permease subunit [Chloroflexota bacterium]
MHLTLAVTRREIREVLRDFNLLFPMLALPALIALIAAAAVLGSGRGPANFIGQAVGGALLEQVPEQQLRPLLYLDVTNLDQMIRVIMKALLIPLFWVTPVALTSTVAADSFVGEKERNTIEPLLATPISDGQLFAAKLATAVIPATAGTWFGIVLFGLLTARYRGPYFPHFILGDPDWLFSMFVVVPLMALLAAAVAALISTRVATYRSAYQLNGLVVLPIILLLVPQTVVLFLFTPYALLLIAGLFAAVDAVLVALAMRLFDRERIARGKS